MADKKRAINKGFLVTAKLLDATTGDSIDISNTIENVMVRKRFIQEVFPLFTLDIRTTEDIRNIMRDHDISVHLLIQSYNLVSENNDSSTNDESDPIPEEVIFDGTIRIYDKPFVTTTAKKEEEQDTSDTENQSNSAPFVFYKLSGVPEELISKNEEIVNVIYKDTDITSATVNLFTTVDKETQLFIQQPDNRDTYRNIIVPPLNLVPAIEFLDKYYKLYSSNFTMFYDNIGAYIYAPLSGNIPEDNFIECSVLSTESTAALDSAIHPLIDEDNNIYLKLRSLPSFNNNTRIQSHFMGSETIFYSYDDNFDLNTREDGDAKSYNKTRYLWNDQSKQVFENNFAELVKHDKSTAITLQNINPNIINPFTKIRLISNQYQEAAGDYLITEVSCIFGSGDMKHYTNTVAISAVGK